jgi:hypothetical protein
MSGFLKKSREKGKLFQDKIKRIFEGYGLTVKILDNNTNKSRPDYFVSFKNNENKGFICECKSKSSAGIIYNKYHVSMLDDTLPEVGVFHLNQNVQNKCDTDIVSTIKKALSQYQTLIGDIPFYKKFPFVIALDFDFFADRFDYIFDIIIEDIIKKEGVEKTRKEIEKTKKEMKKISAVIRIERNIEQNEEFKNLSTEDLEKMIESGQEIKEMPQESIRLKVLLNSKAKIEFKPKEFLKNPIVLIRKKF